ncbi:MAG: alpha-mannosidase [Planctomycetes bacterium]|nr:alpha-mannosidase [Planctomycetota bacterium]
MTSASQPAPQPLPDLAGALDRLQAEIRHWIDRFRAEIDFAKALATRLPREAAGWPALIERAERLVGEGLATGDAGRIRSAIESAERQLAEIGTVAKTFTISCSGHAHIDMNWLWGWPETVATTVDTFETVLKLMDEFPTFTFSQSQASVYQIARDYQPDLVERIAARVKEGRWEITAAHWVEGDRNCASGESLCRHLLYTRRYMKEMFGLSPEDITVDWSPDTFGHAHTIPSIDARGGVKHYYSCRTGTTDRPAVFWWKGPDGERVLVNREILWYNSEPRPASTAKLLEFFDKTGSRDWLQVYGVGDHGGGPTRRDLRCVVDMNTWPIFPNFRFGTVKAFFARLEKLPNLPTLDQELNYEFTGCYTSQSGIKKANRVGENLMSEADIAATLAHAVVGRAYPNNVLVPAWRDVLFSHFHDILPGSGVRDTREYNAGMIQRIKAAAGQVRTQSLRALAKGIDTTVGGRFVASTQTLQPEHESTAMGGGAGRANGEISVAGHIADGPRAAVVFNPTAWKRDEIARVTVWDMDTGPTFKSMKDRSFVVRAADGTTVAAQRVGDGHYWGHNFVDLLFPATVGGMGWATYQVAEAPVGEKPAEPKGKVSAHKQQDGGWGVNNPVGAVTLENDLVKVGFDRATGGICSLVLKATGQEFADAKKPLGVLEYVLERPAGMTAWVLGDTQEQRGLEIEGLDILQGGPHVAIVRAKVKVSNETRFNVDYELQAGSPQVTVSVDGTWLERGWQEKGIPRLQIRFAFALAEAKARYEIPYGSIARNEPAGREVPALRWASVAGIAAGKSGGCSVLNDCKYGHSLDGSTLRVNIVRSSFDPDPLPELGQQQCRFAIVPFTGEAPAADLARQGAGFNHPLQTVTCDHHAGKVAHAVAAIACAQPNVIVTQLKRAEDDDALILRLVETAGSATTAQVTLTRGVLGSITSAIACDVLERPLADNGVSTAGDRVSVTIPAHGIATVKVALSRAR